VTENDSGNDPKTSRTKQLYALAFAATEFGVMVAGGTLLGSYLDRHFHLGPLFTFLGLIAGFVVGLKFLISLTKRV
jgi:F0F1-type ATP synthase assembly protein I